jgi:hypothetical protein
LRRKVSRHTAQPQCMFEVVIRPVSNQTHARHLGRLFRTRVLLREQTILCFQVL